MKLGIVGSGQIVHDFLSASAKMKDVEIIAISTIPAEKEVATTLADRYHIAEVFVDNKKMFEDKKIDTIYIGVPNHCTLNSKRSFNEWVNVICEKNH